MAELGDLLQSAASWLVLMAGAYLSVGLLFALAFVVWGAPRIDPQAVGGSWGFRLAILPASAALWPILALRWIAGSPPPEERNAHRQRSAGAGGGSAT